MAKFERHVFVCTNQRDASAPRGSCTLDGKGLLHGLFKEKIAQAGLAKDVRANKSGCLEQCEHGPVVVVYPEQVWYGFVQPEDVDEIVREHLVGGRPVERLVLADNCLNTAACPHKPAGLAKPAAKDAAKPDAQGDARTRQRPGETGSAEDAALIGVL